MRAACWFVVAAIGLGSGPLASADQAAGPATSREGEASGFRATSGVFLGSRLGIWGGAAPTMLSGNLANLERHSFSLLTPPTLAEVASAERAFTPYLGFGYSAASLKSGWGFSADLGLLPLSPGSAVRLGRVFTGGQSLDDLLRELRWSPLLQLGVSYQF